VFRWFLTRVQPLRDADGRIVRWFGSNTNIDERRRNDDFKETFVGVLGHDLRNPLNTILTTSRVLVMRQDTPADIRKKLERVTSSGVRMQRMIEQLLDLTRARLTAGIPITLSDTAVDLEVPVTRIVEELRVAHPGSTIELRTTGDCSMRIDTDRFEQVVSNLVGNAVTHGDPTRPIQVDLQSGATAITMSVENHGPPIDSEFPAGSGGARYPDRRQAARRRCAHHGVGHQER
jgi:signal transduction histidine kinase